MPDKLIDKYRSYYGSKKEQEMLCFIDKQATHPYYNVPRSLKIKNKRRKK